MGLDIYVRKCADLALAKAAEAAAEAEVNAAWGAAGKYETLTEAQRAEVREKTKGIYALHGCTGKWDRHASIVELDEKPSTIDPTHMFTLGYFRSSYNEGGIERVMGNLGLPGLHEIFDANRSGDDFAPDWDASLARVNSAIEGYSAHLNSDAGRFSVSEIRPIFDRGVTSEKAALEMFMQERGQERGEEFDAFSNAHGNFWLKGIKVHAVITKTYERPPAGNLILQLIGGPAVYVVYEKEREAGKEDWYLTALRIVRESIEFVLAQPDKQHFYLVWSG